VTPAAAAAAKGQKPLSNFERKALTRLEAEMEAISAKRAELQKKVNSFEAARNGSADPEAQHAQAVFDEATRCAWINGEPGFINGDKLEDARTGFAREKPATAEAGSSRYRIQEGAALLADVARRAATATAGGSWQRGDRERLARLHDDSPKMEGATRLKEGLDEIASAHRDATRAYEHVHVRSERRLKLCLEHARHVGAQSQVERTCPLGCRQREQHRTI
jgi:hypothetical protein